MQDLLANIAVAVATLATLFFLVPQIVKLVRTGDSAGVSTTWPAIGFISNIGWFVYFIHEALWASLLARSGPRPDMRSRCGRSHAPDDRSV